MDDPQTKTSDLMGSDAYPGETLEKQEAQEPTLPPLPDAEPDLRPQRYRWVFVNGEMQLSPVHDHEKLMRVARADLDAAGPVALGEVNVNYGRATWNVQATNVGLRGVYDIAAHFSKEVGWEFHGLRDRPGFDKGVETYWCRERGDDVEIAPAPIRGGTQMDVVAGVVRVAKVHPGIEEWAADNHYKVAEVPGGGNMLDHVRHREDLEMFDRQDPNWDPEPDNPDFEPEGPFSCPHCDFKPKTFGEFKLHTQDHQGLNPGEIEDGHFPQIEDFDAPLPLRRHQPYPEMAWNGVQAKVMVLPDAKLAYRIPEFKLYSNLFGFEEGTTIFGAFQDGGLVGYAVVREPIGKLSAPQMNELMMVQSGIPGRGIGTALLETVKRYYPTFYSHADTPQGEALMRSCGMVNVRRQRWHFVAGQEPKDMIEADVPFIYDIKQDTLEIGHPGTGTHEINGQFTPGGIVEGVYQPGGKLVIMTTSSWPFSFRHLMDLWYHNAPQMRITSLEHMEPDGSTTKLAADQGMPVGQYIRTLSASDPAADAAHRALRDAGGTVYCVGGAVRDALRGATPNDVDLMVSGIPVADVEHALRKLPGQVIETGKRFGVFRYKTPGGQHEVEVALPRSDQYDTGRRGEGKISVDPDLPIEQDLHRRDFTANSMAVNLDDGDLVDPYGGAHDISRGVLRTTHPDSFQEDPTRLVRALTAHGQYGLVPDERTRHEMEANGHLLRGESPDSINKALDKLFKSENPASGIRLAHETGVLQHLFPEVDDNWEYDQNNPHHNYPLGEHLMHVLDNIARITKDPDVRMAALLHDTGKPASAWTDPQTGSNHYYYNRETDQGQDHEGVGAKMAYDRMSALNYPVARRQRVADLIQHHMFAPFNSPKGGRRFLQRVGPHADDLLNLREADQTGKGQTPEEVAARTQADAMRQTVENVRAQGQATNLSTLNVNGSDLVQMGLRPGPAIGQILNQLMESVIENPMANVRETLLEQAQQLVSQQPPESFARA